MQISYPGSGSSNIFGLNDSGVSVGVYSSQNTAGEGFQYPSYSQIIWPAEQTTFPTGINDAGHVVGYGGATGNYVPAFLDIGGNFYPVNYPGASQTFVYGINGDAEIVGGYSDSTGNHGFLFQPTPPTWTGVYTPINYPEAQVQLTTAYGISNNGQVVGFYVDSASNAHGFVLDLTSGVYASFDYSGSAATYGFCVNDFGQMVGEQIECIVLCSVLGFIATPQ